MLYQFSGDGSRPTYFEMLASEQLSGSLKAAVLHVIGVHPKPGQHQTGPAPAAFRS
jgi:hypothetical protein